MVADGRQCREGSLPDVNGYDDPLVNPASPPTVASWDIGVRLQCEELNSPELGG